MCHTLYHNISTSLNVETNSSHVQISILAFEGYYQKHLHLATRLRTLPEPRGGSQCLLNQMSARKTQHFLKDIKLLGASVWVKAPQQQFRNSLGLIPFVTWEQMQLTKPACPACWCLLVSSWQLEILKSLLWTAEADVQPSFFPFPHLCEMSVQGSFLFWEFSPAVSAFLLSLWTLLGYQRLFNHLTMELCNLSFTSQPYLYYLEGKVTLTVLQQLKCTLWMWDTWDQMCRTQFSLKLSEPLKQPGWWFLQGYSLLT